MQLQPGCYHTIHSEPISLCLFPTPCKLGEMNTLPGYASGPNQIRPRKHTDKCLRLYQVLKSIPKHIKMKLALLLNVINRASDQFSLPNILEMRRNFEDVNKGPVDIRKMLVRLPEHRRSPGSWGHWKQQVPQRWGGRGWG